MRILMVCLGNICRSPLAEGILKHKIDQLGLDWEIDSSGTSGFHIGGLPDARSIAIAEEMGVDIKYQRSSKFKAEDLDAFDLIFAMDSSNYQNIIRLADNEAQKQKVDLIMNLVKPGWNQNVPDPYYGEFGFQNVYKMLDEATDKLIEKYT